MKPIQKRYHYAKWIRSDGAVSALCFDPPHSIDLRRASWTNRPEAVTCPKCRAILSETERDPGGIGEGQIG